MASRMSGNYLVVCTPETLKTSLDSISSAYQTYLLIINQLEFRVLTYLPERLEQEIPRTL